MLLTEAELRSDVKKGPAGGYLLCGEEGYLIRHYAGALRAAVLGGDASLAAFNSSSLPEDATPGQLENALAALPLMSSHTLVEWVSPDTGSWGKADTEAFLSVLGRLEDFPHAVLVIRAGDNCLDRGLPKRPTALFSKLSAVLRTVVFPYQTPEKLMQWLSRHLAGDGLTADRATLAAVVATAGRDMFTLSGEVEKLTAYAAAAGRTTVTQEDVAAVCSVNAEEEAFGLSNAILAGDRTGALRALDFFRQRREDPNFVMGSIIRVVCDLLLAAELREGGLDRSAAQAASGMNGYKFNLYWDCVGELGCARVETMARRARMVDLRLKRGERSWIGIEKFLATLPRRRSASHSA